MITLRLFSALALATVLLLPLGCAPSLQPPRSDYIGGPLPQQFRRTTDYRSETFWSRLSPDAYERLERLPQHLSTDQQLIVQEFGAPDYQREFESLENEDVVEWLNVDRNTLYQFIDGSLVFEGDMRDLEHVLLRRGYPYRVIYNIDYPGVERITFMYREVFGSGLEFYSFARGMLIHQERTL